MDLSVEVFWDSNRQCTFAEYLAPDELVAYLRQTAADRIGAEGLFCAKVMGHHLNATLAALRGASGFRQLSDYQRLQAVFPKPRLIYLSRLDKLRQGISFARAKQTNVLHKYLDGRLYTRSGLPALEARYDYDLILSCIERVSEGERIWERFFAKNRLTPLRLTYEVLCTDPRLAIEQVLRAVGQDSVQDRHLRTVVQKLADETTEDWVARFCADEAARAG